VQTSCWHARLSAGISEWSAHHSATTCNYFRDEVHDTALLCVLFTKLQVLPLTELDHNITHFNMFDTCELVASSYVSVKWEQIVNNMLLGVSLEAWCSSMMYYQKLLVNLFIQFTVCSNHFYVRKLQVSVGWKKHYMQLN
jgi:hypothetical protein